MPPSCWIDFNDLVFEDKITQNAAASIYEGEYKNEKVAIKVFVVVRALLFSLARSMIEYNLQVLNPRLINLDNFQNEYQMLRYRSFLNNVLTLYSKIKSNHLAFFYGICIQPKICVVMEYCGGGSLWDALRNDDTLIPWRQFFKWAKGIISILKMLHSQKPQIIHRNIRPDKLMVPPPSPQNTQRPINSPAFFYILLKTSSKRLTSLSKLVR